MILFLLLKRDWVQRDKESALDYGTADSYEEALMIQENYGMTSNVVEWENEGFLTYLIC